MLDSFKGQEETGPEKGVYGGHTLAWSDVRENRKKKVEENPHVLVGMLTLSVSLRYRRFLL